MKVTLAIALALGAAGAGGYYALSGSEKPQQRYLFVDGEIAGGIISLRVNRNGEFVIHYEEDGVSRDVPIDRGESKLFSTGRGTIRLERDAETGEVTYEIR